MFAEFANAVHVRFLKMSERELYVTNVQDIFDKYLAAFPKGSNPMYRKRTVHDCQCCKQFVRRLGHLVNIVDGKIVTLWDDLNIPEPFKTVADALSALVKSAKVLTVFRTKESGYGTHHNFDPVSLERHDHFYGNVASRHRSNEPDTIRGQKDTAFQVMKRGVEEIRVADLDDVLSLIDSGGLYRGDEHKAAVVGFKELLVKFNEAMGLYGSGDLFVWENLGHRNAAFRNTVIGTLLVDLAEGKSLEDAVKAFEVKVAPMNYQRPTAVITQRMIEGAVETLNTLGLGAAIYRRYAKLSDVSVNNVLFVDNESKSKMKDSVAALLEDFAERRTVAPKNAAPINADGFVRTILPEAKTLDVLVQNRHVGNFLSLTTADKDVPKLFKWDNPFAWSYDGDTTDSVKQRVKAAGGNINAKLRVSLSWFNTDDLDLHATTPDGRHIHYGNKCGILDVDMNVSGETRTPVENLAFNVLVNGRYRIYVDQFRQRETTDVGFAIEIEYDGVLRQFSYDKAVRGEIPCFELVVAGGKLVDIIPGAALKEGSSSQDKWGIKTETLVPVSAVMFSPNCWGDQKIGAEHLIFALKNCVNPGETRGIYNEYLRADLHGHRKVFEVLGAKSKCKPSPEQISGVGFTKARGDSVTVVVNGRRSYTVGF